VQACLKSEAFFASFSRKTELYGGAARVKRIDNNVKLCQRRVKRYRTLPSRGRVLYQAQKLHM
jgi:hypothetical protein